MAGKRKCPFKNVYNHRGLFFTFRLVFFSPQVLELLCNKAEPHRCSAGLMGSLSPSWRRPGISGDRAGRDGQKWGSSCHDNGWGLLIGQGNERASKTFFFFFFFSFFLIPPPWWNEYAHPGTNHKPTEHFGSSHMCCITSASSAVFSLCSYTITHSRAGPSHDNC